MVAYFSLLFTDMESSVHTLNTILSQRINLLLTSTSAVFKLFGLFWLNSGVRALSVIFNTWLLRPLVVTQRIPIQKLFQLGIFILLFETFCNLFAHPQNVYITNNMFLFWYWPDLWDTKKRMWFEIFSELTCFCTLNRPLRLKWYCIQQKKINKIKIKKS